MYSGTWTRFFFWPNVTFCSREKKSNWIFPIHSSPRANNYFFSTALIVSDDFFAWKNRVSSALFAVERLVKSTKHWVPTILWWNRIEKSIVRYEFFHLCVNNETKTAEILLTDEINFKINFTRNLESSSRDNTGVKNGGALLFPNRYLERHSENTCSYRCLQNPRFSVGFATHLSQ